MSENRTGGAIVPTKRRYNNKKTLLSKGYARLKHKMLEFVGDDSLNILDGQNGVFLNFILIISCCIFLGSFLYFFVVGVVASQKSKFLATSADAGDCEVVGKSVSLSLYADYQGELLV